MTETIAKTGEKPSVPAVEVSHYPNTDIVINLDSKFAGLAYKLSDLFKDGVPASWEEIGPTQEELDDMEEDPSHPGHQSAKVGFAVGEIDGVKFLFKPKGLSGKDTFYHRKKAALKGGYVPRKEALRANQIYNSILNEIGISPKIKKIMSGDVSQEIARRYGHKSLEYIEPIIGIVNRETGNKALIYEYIEGAVNIRTIMNQANFNQIQFFENEIDKLLKQNGVENMDKPAQFIVDSSGRLYNIDAEGYQRVPAHESNE